MCRNATGGNHNPRESSGTNVTIQSLEPGKSSPWYQGGGGGWNPLGY